MISRSTGAIFYKTYTRWKFHSQTLTETRFWLVCAFFVEIRWLRGACVCVRVGHTFVENMYEYMHTQLVSLSLFSMLCVSNVYVYYMHAQACFSYTYRCWYERLSPPLIQFYHGIPAGLDGKCGGWKRTILIHISKNGKLALIQSFPNPKEENVLHKMLENWIYSLFLKCLQFVSPGIEH